LKKLLVIGNYGFIGTNVVSRLVGLDIYTADVIGNGQKHFKIDQKNPDFEKIFSSVQPDFCVNASGAANVSASFENPDQDRALNLSNVELMLNAIAEKSTHTRFINLSSAAVYGSPKTLPIFEYSDLNPISPYGVHKLEAERLLQEFAEKKSLKTLSLRVFSCYGNGQKKLLFWDIFSKARSNNFKEIELFGSGEESRDYIHVYDLVDVIYLCFDKAEFDGQSINAASGKESFIKEVAQLAAFYIDPKLTIRFSGCSRIGDPLRWRADVSHITNLGFESKIELKDGLSAYYEWVRRG